MQVDIEDLGGQGPRRRRQGGQGQTGGSSAANGTASGSGPPEMLNPLIRGSLTKQVRYWRELPSRIAAQPMPYNLHVC